MHPEIIIPKIILTGFLLCRSSTKINRRFCSKPSWLLPQRPIPTGVYISINTMITRSTKNTQQSCHFLTKQTDVNCPRSYMSPLSINKLAPLGFYLRTPILSTNPYYSISRLPLLNALLCCLLESRIRSLH